MACDTSMGSRIGTHRRVGGAASAWERGRLGACRPGAETLFNRVRGLQALGLCLARVPGGLCPQRRSVLCDLALSEPQPFQR